MILKYYAVYSNQDGNSSHFFVRNRPEISPPQPLYSIPVCKKFSCNYYEIDIYYEIGIYDLRRHQ